MTTDGAKAGTTPEDAGKALQKQLLAEYYHSLSDEGRNGRKVAYLFVPGNVIELVRCFDMLPVYPEINALQCGIKKVAGELILQAENLGYSSDVCGYVKNDIGLMLSDRMSPFGQLPKPDLLVCNYSGCNTFVKWFEALAHFYGAELFVLDIPYLRERSPSTEDITYVVSQLEELANVCARVSGVPFDRDRLRHVLELSAKAERLWVEVLHTAQGRPSPFDAYFEAVFYMAPLNILRGTEGCVEYYRLLLEELRARSAENRGPIPEEKFRVVIEGPPPWPHFRSFWELFKRWGVCAVASTYSKVGGLFDQGIYHDPSRPLESIAEYAMNSYTNWNLGLRLDLLKRYAKEYNADAVVIHSTKSCRSFSVGQADFRDALTKEEGLPTLMVESDLADPRYYSEAQIKNRIDAFFESLTHRRLVGA
ncbi:MAG TPA: 2-hydroxyacyl-CoA dehydratase family protein [Thermoplasmata archaeon]|nr:2-hydroxyacyl-CoA dehydratase family protein [Thermoplasmata archaeon]